jgi:hypothetical protein
VVLITNDVDEGIMLADRIVPLSAGPGATLGPSIAVDIARPRDRKALNHDPRFKQIRAQVIDYLLGPGGRSAAATRLRLSASETRTQGHKPQEHGWKGRRGAGFVPVEPPTTIP